MSLAYTPDRLRLPDSLQAQLHEYRRRVWTIKMVEAVAAAAFGVLVAYLLLFGLDRVWDTPGWLRITLFCTARSPVAIFPGGSPLGLEPAPARATRHSAGEKAPPRRRPVAGHHRAREKRLRAGPARVSCARRPWARSPHDAQKARFPRCGPEPPPPALGRSGGRSPGYRSGAPRPLSRPPPPTPGTGSCSPGRVRRGTRSRCSSRWRSRSSSRTARRFPFPSS